MGRETTHSLELVMRRGVYWSMAGRGRFPPLLSCIATWKVREGESTFGRTRRGIDKQTWLVLGVPVPKLVFKFFQAWYLACWRVSVAARRGWGIG